MTDMPARATHQEARGFTLIELLVAITILAIVAVLGWRGLDAIVHARTTLNAELERTRGLQLAFAQMQSDAGQIATPAVLGTRPALAAQQNRLVLARFVFAENQPSRLQVVTWRVQDGRLTRSESIATRDLRELDAAWAAATSNRADAGTPAITLHTDVERMDIRLWLQSSGWVAAVPAATATQTPAGIEVSLQLRERQSWLTKVFLLGAA